MTPSEFTAWFYGFTEGMDGPPNAEQWLRIKEQVELLRIGANEPYRIVPLDTVVRHNPIFGTGDGLTPRSTKADPFIPPAPVTPYDDDKNVSWLGK